MIYHVNLPVKIKSPNGGRGHWKAYHYGYSRPVREAVGLAVKYNVGAERAVGSLTVTLTRIAPRKLDLDNLVAGMKPVRDGVADGLGMRDDRESRSLSWQYAQMRGIPGEYGLRISIEAERSIQ